MDIKNELTQISSMLHIARGNCEVLLNWYNYDRTGSGLIRSKDSRRNGSNASRTGEAGRNEKGRKERQRVYRLGYTGRNRYTL